MSHQNITELFQEREGERPAPFPCSCPCVSGGGRSRESSIVAPGASRGANRLLRRQLRAALGTAALQYEATGLGRHARTKTVSASSL
jgi:hypothetical protein